jgi:hypothetical protein
MFETEFRINQFLIQYCQKLCADIPEEQFTAQPMPGVNHPAWILGHLAVASDAAAALVGGEKVLPEQWHKLFGRGSVLTANRADYPSKSELLQAVEAGYQRARELASGATAEQLARPNVNRMLREALPTVQNAYSFLLTAHFSLHLGQFSAWRRMVGLAPLF